MNDVLLTTVLELFTENKPQRLILPVFFLLANIFMKDLNSYKQY